jgi:hypothetical protein
MAHPWLADKNWETGDTSEWDSVEDGDSKFVVRHYTDLARLSPPMTPYSGAYAAHIDLSLGTADAYAIEEDDFDAATIYIGFAFQAKDLAMDDGDVGTILSLNSSGDTPEVTVAVLRDGNDILLQATGEASTVSTSLIQNEWHWIELKAVNDDRLTFYVDGYEVGEVTSLTQDVVVEAWYGLSNADTSLTGHLLLGRIVADDARLGVLPRFLISPVITKSMHLFIGPGTVETAALISSTAGNIARLYDTDRGDTLPQQGFLAELTLTENSAIEGPIFFSKGCYVEMTGTNPRAQVTILDVDHTSYRHATTSDAFYKYHAERI